MLDFHHTDNLGAKVFARLFQKAAQVEGAEPSAPPQRRNCSAFLLCQAFFFAPAVSKKKAGDELGRLTLRKPSPFFLWSSRPKKEPKKGHVRDFAPAGATRASRPRPAQAFEKACPKLCKLLCVCKAKPQGVCPAVFPYSLLFECDCFLCLIRDVRRGQAVHFQQGRNLAGSAKHVLGAHVEHGYGTAFANRLRNSRA